MGLLLTASLTRVSSGDQVAWKSIGRGGTGAAIFGAAISPVNPNIIILGSDVGGLFRTTDGGLTWKAVNNAIASPDTVTNYRIWSIAFAPVNGLNPNAQIVYTASPPHFYRSADAGATWTRRALMPGDGDPTVIVVDPTDPNIVYAAGNGYTTGTSRLWKTTDGFAGATASCIDPNNCNVSVGSLVIRPSDRTQLLACTPAGIYKTTDSAASWTKIGGPGGIPAGLPHDSCQRMTVHASGVVYMTLATPNAGGSGWKDPTMWHGGVYKSSTWGDSWTAANGTDGPNLLVNGLGHDEGQFEFLGGSGPAEGWSYLGDSRTVTRVCDAPENLPRTGCAIKMEPIDLGDTSSRGVSKTIPIAVQNRNKLHKISVWMRAPSGQGVTLYVRAHMQNAAGAGIRFPALVGDYIDPIASVVVHSEWRKYQSILYVPDDVAQVALEMYTFFDDGKTWMDEVSIQPIDSLPDVVGAGATPTFANYDLIVVDPADVNTLYVGTAPGGFADDNETGTSGIWKTTDAGATWRRVTRSLYHDNVLDGRGTAPVCGDGVCGGRWEHHAAGGVCPDFSVASTCAADCAISGSSSCCGNNICELAEDADNCFVDCPRYAEAGLPYNESPRQLKDGVTSYAINGISYGVESLAIGNGGTNGKGNAGSQTLSTGGILLTEDGGNRWTEISNDLTVSSTPPYEGWKSRGDTNWVFTYPVVTDAANPQRVYYGDSDNYLNVSFDGGVHFVLEGKFVWPVGGDAVTSMILDPVDPNHAYFGVFNGDDINTLPDGGVIDGHLDPTTNRWTWAKVGVQAPDPGGTDLRGGNVSLVRHSDGTLFAAVGSKGVFRLDGSTWNNTYSGSNWKDSSGQAAIPAGWKIMRLAIDGDDRLYAGAGYNLGDTPPSGETGVWVSADRGVNWTKISSAEMDREPITWITPAGKDGSNRPIVLVGTWFAYRCGWGVPDTPECAGRQGGGLYRGCLGCSAPNVWSFTRSLIQPRVTGIAVHPTNPSIAYAYAGSFFYAVDAPGLQAGIYKSVDQGLTWSLLDNNGLSNLKSGRLYFSAISPYHTIYASTVGGGVYEGTINCGPVSEGFADVDGDGVPDCAFTNINQQIAMTTGSIVSGTYSSLSCSSTATYEVLKEQTSGSQRKMIKVWKFDNVPTGKAYDLWVEGFKTVAGTPSDNFNFSLTTKAAGSACTNSDGIGPTLLTVSKTGDDNQAQIASAGTINNPVVCLRVQDSIQGSDNKSETLTLDRVCLRALP
jgi:photosystem II stability/assembly factor-like uncharacterized protein